MNPLFRGFTLIEVLVASVILFAALGVFSATVQTNLLAQRKYVATNQLLAPLPVVMASIRGAVRENMTDHLTGSGTVLGVEYRYQANLIAFRSPPSRFDSDAGDFAKYEPRYRLYEVKLRLATRDASRDYVYRELSWLPNVARAVDSR